MAITVTVTESPTYITVDESNLTVTLNQSDSTLPVITLITVVHNNVNHIKSTVQSVLSQSYPHIEYVVIDGNSNDGTVEILEEFRDEISVRGGGQVRDQCWIGRTASRPGFEGMLCDLRSHGSDNRVSSSGV